MKLEHLTKLNSILDSEDTKKQKIEDAKAQKAAKERNFVSDFNDHVRTVIKPAMEQIGAVLTAKGHGFNISHQDGKGASPGIQLNASVKMMIYPNSGGDVLSGNYPFVGFDTSVDQQKVRIIESTIGPGRSGHSGAKSKQYKLKELSTEQIEEEIIDTISNIFQ